MVAPIEAACKLWECYFEERTYFDAGIKHLLIKLVFHAEAPHMVINHPHMHPRLCFGYEVLCDGAAYFVILKDVVLEIDKCRGVVDVVEQRFEFTLTIDLVAGKINGTGERFGKFYLLLTFIAQRE